MASLHILTSIREGISSVGLYCTEFSRTLSPNQFSFSFVFVFQYDLDQVSIGHEQSHRTE